LLTVKKNIDIFSVGGKLKMNPAQRVIEKFGGQSALARLVGKGQSTIAHWSKTGSIPAKWQPQLLRIAAENSVNLSSADFMDSPDYQVIKMDDGKPRIPKATWWGVLPIGEAELPVFVLDNGLRVISRTGATGILSDRKGGGNLENYLKVEALAKYLPPDLSGLSIEFSIHVTNKTVLGYSAETFIEICRAYLQALTDGALDTERQKEIAAKASMFLASCAKVGLIALIDEATGYQYDRAADALQIKLKAFLVEEMREWERTFPNELWIEFGRLTSWKGAVTQRPKYWGHLVTELVYGYLDPDVTKWLKDNHPQPRHGRNWHQWLSEQYGLQKLIQHIYTLIGIAKACHNMHELREKMAEIYGKTGVQLTLYLPRPRADLKDISIGVHS
jgi:P63C domain-containing protein